VTGAVSRYDEDEGHGLIAGDDGETYWVHFMHIVGEGYRALSVGERVEFQWDGEMQDRRRRASAVVPLGGGE